ncbi:MAG: glycosyltransferase [Sulfurovaceae bacterium]|nr:glycosyltransferase [Sulfurovaceae bacterium]
MSKIAIIMSVYKNDHIEELQEALESLYTQTLQGDIFIQQDGEVSPLVESYLKQKLDAKKIKYLGKREENRGLAYSLNELIQKIDEEYEYIARMDADDISVADRVRLQYEFMQSNKNIDVVGGYIEEFGTDMDYKKIVKYPLKHEEMYQFFSKRVPLAHVSAFFRTSYFKKARVYRTDTLSNEDTLLWMDGFKHGCQFANVDKVVVNVRVSSDFFSRRGGFKKAWGDFKDRLLVINTLGYNAVSYCYAAALFMVNIAPSKVKVFLYKRLR